MICVRNNGTIAGRSALTFDMDPPSEHYLKSISRSVLKSLPARRQKDLPECVEPSTHDDGQISFMSSVVPGHAHNDLNVMYEDSEFQSNAGQETMMLNYWGEGQSHATRSHAVQTNASLHSGNLNALIIYEDEESQSIQANAVQEPTEMHHWVEERSYESQQSAVQSVASAKKRDMNTVLHYGDTSIQSHVAEEPAGIFYFDGQQSQATQSHSQQAPLEPANEWIGSSSVVTNPPPSVATVTVGSALRASKNKNHGWDTAPSNASQPLHTDSFYTYGPSTDSIGTTPSSIFPGGSKKKKKKKKGSSKRGSMPHLQSYGFGSENDSYQTYSARSFV